MRDVQESAILIFLYKLVDFDVKREKKSEILSSIIIGEIASTSLNSKFLI